MSDLSIHDDALGRALKRIDVLPEPEPMPQVSRDRVSGMLLGIAIGDALGNRTEGLTPGTRAARHGEIRDYLPNKHADEQPVGTPSDDTQMTFWTLEHLLDNGRLDPNKLAAVFANPTRRIFGIGGTVRAFRNEYASNGHDWRRASQPSAGNGSLMRLAPVLLPYLTAPSVDMYRDAAIAGAITHNDSAAIAACVAFVAILWEALRMDSPPEGRWWIDTFREVVEKVEDKTTYRPRSPNVEDFHGTLSQFLRDHVDPVFSNGDPSLRAAEFWFSGAYLLETVPSVIYILALHARDSEEAIVRSVMDTKDNDTVAAIVGAAVGALNGESSFPVRWKDGLLGRLGADDGGAVFELIEAACRRWIA